MFKPIVTGLGFSLLGTVPSLAQTSSIELPVSLYMRVELIDAKRITSDWTESDAKRLIFGLNRDKQIDDVERQLVSLLLTEASFTIVSEKNGEARDRLVRGNLSPEAMFLLSDLVGVTPTDPYFGPEDETANLLVFRDEKPVWAENDPTANLAYEDITPLSGAYTGVRWLSERFGLAPSDVSDRFRFVSDRPALEGDLVSILAAMRSADVQEWSSACSLKGEALSQGSKRTLTQDAINNCMVQIFGEEGDSFPDAPLTRGHMLYQINSAYKEANDKGNLPYKFGD